VSERALPVEAKRIRVDDGTEISALLARPKNPTHLFVLAHGAGAGMSHPFMEQIARALASRGIATLRYQFPYVEKKRRRPDPPALLTATVRAAVEAAGQEGLTLLAGGKSMGGRMTSTAASERALPGVKGLVFLGFPLHQVGNPSTKRGEHLSRVGLPMLFVQGNRDSMADLDLLEPLLQHLDQTTLHVVEGGDHGFHVPKKSGRTDADALDEAADRVASWAGTL